MTTKQPKYLQGADRVRRVILLGTPNLGSVGALHSFIKGFKIGAGAAYIELLERYFEKHLERARRFTWSLTVPLPEQPYKLIVLGGDCKLTPARIIVEEVNGISKIRLWPREIRHNMIY